MSEWRAVRLGDLIDITHGYAFAGQDFVEDPRFPTLLTPANFAVGGGFQEARMKTFSGQVPQGYVLAPGDLVVTMTDLSRNSDTLGYPALVPGDKMYLHNQRIGKVVARKDSPIDLPFLNYYLRGRSYRAHVVGGATGTTVKHSSPKRILSFVGSMPEVGEQRAIAEVLGALDDKIAANAKVVVRADHLVATSVQRMVVEGSESRPLSDLALFVNGRAFTKDATRTGRVVIRIAELNSGIGGSTVYNDIDVADEHLARPGDLLFAWSGSLTVRRWFRDEGIVNQHIFKVLPRDGYPMWLVNYALRRKLADFKSIAADKATTMGHIQRRHLDHPVLVPNPSVVDGADAAMSALWNRALAAEVESLKLIETRDELLPLLMSGKVRVRDAEKVVKGVV